MIRAVFEGLFFSIQIEHEVACCTGCRSSVPFKVNSLLLARLSLLAIQGLLARLLTRLHRASVLSCLELLLRQFARRVVCLAAAKVSQRYFIRRNRAP